MRCEIRFKSKFLVHVWLATFFALDSYSTNVVYNDFSAHLESFPDVFLRLKRPGSFLLTSDMDKSSAQRPYYFHDDKWRPENLWFSPKLGVLLTSMDVLTSVSTLINKTLKVRKGYRTCILNNVSVTHIYKSHILSKQYQNGSISRLVNVFCRLKQRTL